MLRGVLLHTPGVGRVLAQEALGLTTEVPLAPYALDRFRKGVLLTGRYGVGAVSSGVPAYRARVGDWGVSKPHPAGARQRSVVRGGKRLLQRPLHNAREFLVAAKSDSSPSIRRCPRALRCWCDRFDSPRRLLPIPAPHPDRRSA